MERIPNSRIFPSPRGWKSWKKITKKDPLGRVLREERFQKGKANQLKSDLEGMNSDLVSKQNETDFLFAKLTELKSSKLFCKSFNGEDDSENHQGIIKLTHTRDTEPERLAETLLHEEMWREVFSKVDDGLDLLNASRTCQHFHDILDPLKNNFLFEKVLPTLLPHLGFRDILKCRLVCRNWRTTINSFLEEGTKINMQDFCLRACFFNPFYIISDRVISAYSFRNRYNYRYPNKFLQRFNTSVRNPFIANAVTILLSGEVEEPSVELKYRKEIGTIMETFGRHIHHFKLLDPNFQFGSFSGIGPAELLRELFSKAPNLQTLVVQNYHNRDSARKFEFEDVTDSLPNFKTLVCKMDEKLSIANWLFRNFHLQITKLQLQSFEGLLVASEFTWPEVTELCLESSYMCEAKDHLKCFESFPGLKKLCLSVCDSTLPNILHIIQLLPAVCPSFHALQLYLSLSQTERLNLIAPREVDTLELNVSNDDNWTPYRDFTFLVCFPFIKRLSIVCKINYFRGWEVWRRLKEVKVEIVELLESSNVWIILPNLEMLQLQNNIYKRPKTPHAICE